MNSAFGTMDAGNCWTLPLSELTQSQLDLCLAQMTLLDAETETDEYESSNSMAVALCDDAEAVPSAPPARIEFSHPPARPGSLDFSRVAGWLCLFFALGLCGLSWMAPAPRPESRTASAAAQAPLTLVPIRDVEVGTALPARDNPSGEHDTRFGPIDPPTWRIVELTAPKRDGSTAEVTLLRPVTWLEEQVRSAVRVAPNVPQPDHSATAGKVNRQETHNEFALGGAQIHIDVPECGISGWARICAVRPCPAIESRADIRIVTGKFVHHNARVIDLHLEGESAPIGTTTNHPFWSVDRNQFVRADELQTGENLVRLSGHVVQVSALSERPGRHTVYNLKVHTDHIYHVGEGAVLVHNGGPNLPIVDLCPDALAADKAAKEAANGAPKALTDREIKNARQRGVYHAKAAERELIQNGHPGTANHGGFTWPERKQIAETGQYPSDIRWHHINDVKRNPTLADVPNNVVPSRGGTAGHVQTYHPNGGTRGGSTGPLLDRDSLRQQHLNGGGQ